MAVEIGEAGLFITVGIVIGIAIIYMLMQGRVSRKAEQIYSQKRQELDAQFEQKRQELDSHYRSLYSTEMDKWKAEYQLEQQEAVQAQIKAEVNKALNSSRSSLKGKINEQMAPLFPEFASKYVAADARFIGSPIDFVVFRNLHTLANGGDDRKEVEIVFVEVKTGNKSLNPNERAVRSAVENLRVRYDLMKISTDANGNEENSLEAFVPTNGDGENYPALEESRSPLPTPEEFRKIDEAASDIERLRDGQS